MIGIVEKDEPIPIVINKPTTNISSAASDLLFPIISTIEETKVSTPPVLLITLAKPFAAIIIKPIIPIILRPLVKKSCVSLALITPATIKMIKPANEPKMIEFVCSKKA